MLRKFTSLRRFSTNPINVVQAMPTYQKALEFAHEKQYDKSIEKLEETLTEISTNIGEATNLHLYIL